MNEGTRVSWSFNRGAVVRCAMVAKIKLVKELVSQVSRDWAS